MSEPPPREPDDVKALLPVRDRSEGYYRNGIWVPRDMEPDPQPPSLWERLQQAFQARFHLAITDRRVWIPAASARVVLVAVLVIANSGSPATMPGEQRDFLAAVKHGQTAVRAGNDITLVTAARDRTSAVCALLPRDGAVRDWVGTISKVGTVFGGKQGHVSVAVGDDVHLRTWDRASEDGKDRTLVDPNSDVYRSLADLKSGDQVRFSGAFVGKGASCLHETSLFARNGMLTPGFVFRFTAVGPR